MAIREKLKILHLEDVYTDAELVNRELSRAGLVFERLLVDNKTDFIRALNDFGPDIILSDHSLPSFDSLEALTILKQSGLKIPFVLVTATMSEEYAVSVMKEGATDYILKDRMQRLPTAINNAISKFRLEAEHRKAGETQAAILNALSPNITLLNEKGKIVAVNDSWKKSALLTNLGMPNYGVGYSYIAMAEKANAIDADTAAKIAKGIRDIIMGHKQEFTMEYASNLPTGRRWFQIVVAPLVNTSSKGAVVLHIDITDRKHAEESLIKSEANLRSVFENTDLGIILIDARLNIVSFNSNAYAAMGKQYPKKLKVGNGILTCFTTDRKAEIKKAIKLASKGNPVMYETTFTQPDATSQQYEVKLRGVTNGNKDDAGFILTFRDIINNNKKAEA